MKTVSLIICSFFLIAPVAVGKLITHLENRRWRKKLQGVSDRYSTDDEREKTFHMKRFR